MRVFVPVLVDGVHDAARPPLWRVTALKAERVLTYYSTLWLTVLTP